MAEAALASGNRDELLVAHNALKEALGKPLPTLSYTPHPLPHPPCASPLQLCFTLCLCLTPSPLPHPVSHPSPSVSPLPLCRTPFSLRLTSSQNSRRRSAAATALGPTTTSGFPPAFAACKVQSTSEPPPPPTPCAHCGLATGAYLKVTKQDRGHLAIDLFADPEARTEQERVVELRFDWLNDRGTQPPAPDTRPTANPAPKPPRA